MVNLVVWIFGYLGSPYERETVTLAYPHWIPKHQTTETSPIGWELDNLITSPTESHRGLVQMIFGCKWGDGCRWTQPFICLRVNPWFLGHSTCRAIPLRLGEVFGYCVWEPENSTGFEDFPETGRLTEHGGKLSGTKEGLLDLLPTVQVSGKRVGPWSLEGNVIANTSSSKCCLLISFWSPQHTHCQYFKTQI